MPHATPHHTHRKPVPPDEVIVGGWSVVRYAQIVKWPSLITVVLNIIVTTAHWNLALSWFFLIVLTVSLGVSVERYFHGTLANATGLGFASGLIVGVSTSLFQFLWYHNVTAFFEIIRSSLLAILVGLLMSTSAYLLTTTRDSKRKQ
ncbi:MAG: hypothetical protein V1907_03685 [Candidatus Kerfeldbacteria bacterium]